MTQTPTVIPERLEAVKDDAFRLREGSHDAPDDPSAPPKACLLEAEGWIHGEEWGDCPPCVSPVIWRFGQRLNDRLPDDERQELKRFLGRLGGTGGDGLDDERRAIAARWVINTGLPQWLELAGLTARADELRNLEVTEWNAELADLLYKVRDETRKKTLGARQHLRKEIETKVKEKLAEEGKKPAVAAAVAAAAAAAAAVAAAAADADAVAAPYSERWMAVYNAVRRDEKVRAEIRKALPVVDEFREEALQLFDRLIDPKAEVAS